MEINAVILFFSLLKAISFHFNRQKQNTDCWTESGRLHSEESGTNFPDLNLSYQSYLTWTLLTLAALVLLNSHRWDYFSSSWPLPTRPHHHPLSHVSSQVPFDWWQLNKENSSTSGSVKAVRRSGSSTWDCFRPMTDWLAHTSFQVWLPLQATRRTFSNLYPIKAQQ